MDAKDDWKEKLTPEQYHVMREQGTEAAFTGKYWNDHSAGMYKCAACGQELVSSDAKFDSGTGWPSFTKPANLEHVELREDSSSGMKRTEIICKNCGSHLGHVFDDGHVVYDAPAAKQEERVGVVGERQRTHHGEQREHCEAYHGSPPRLVD